MRNAMISVVLLFACGGAFAEVWTVPDGGSIVVGQTQSGSHNKKGDEIRLLGSGVIHQEVEDTTRNAISLWSDYRLLDPSGVVTYDYSDFAEGHPAAASIKPSFVGGISAAEGATLRIKAKDAISVGKSLETLVNFPLFDVGNVAFVDSSEEPASGTIEVNTCATFGQFPHKSVTSVNLTCWSGACLAFAGSNVVERLVEDGVLDLSPYGSRQVWLLGAKMPEGVTLRLNSSSQYFQFRGASVDTGVVPAAWSSVTGGWDRVEFPIEANGATVEFWSKKASSCTFEGRISGGGTIALVGANQRIFTELDGSFKITNTGSGVNEVLIRKLTDGSILKWNAGSSHVEFAEGALNATAIRGVRDGLSFVYNLKPGDDVPAEFLPSRGLGVTQAMILDDGQRVAGVVPADATRIAASPDATVTVANSGAVAVRLQPRSGTFVLEHGAVPDFWFDFSRSETMKPGINGYEKTYPNLVECVVDWRRPDDASIALWNRRAYLTNGSYEFVNTVYGERATGAGPDGDLTYLDFKASSSRIFLSRDVGYNYDAAVPTAFESAVLVFNGKRGGGWGLIGTKSGAFSRSGNTRQDGLMKTASHRVWVDGEEVNPTEAKLIDGWQVITLDLDGELVDGFGYGKYANPDSTPYSGQCYGEILLFKKELTDGQRYCVERELARKWGIAYKGQPQNLGPAVVEGVSGTVRVPENGAAALSGLFSGTIDVRGTVEISGALPPTAADVPAENRLDWYDAEDVGSICEVDYDIRTTPTKITVPNAVAGWLPRGKVAADMKVDDLYLCGVSDRKPFHQLRTNGLTPVRNWIDFNHPELYEPRLYDGNLLRTRQWNGKATSPKDGDVLRAIRQVFMVLDSSNGGGAPLSTKVDGTGAPFVKRSDGSTEAPIWSSGCGTQVKNGVTRLNGTQVVGTSTGFTGEAEVLSLTTTDDANFAFIDVYPNTDSGNPVGDERRQGSIVGEMIFYTAPVPQEDAAKVEAYLLGKWTGTLPDGYADFRGASVTGSGLLKVADLAAMPKIGAGFTGSLMAASGTAWSQTVTIDPSTDDVTGALNCPEGTFDLPAEAVCTLTVEMTERPSTQRTYRYTLVDCAANVHATVFDVQFGANVPRRARVVRTGNKIELLIEPSGLMLMVR